MTVPLSGARRELIDRAGRKHVRQIRATLSDADVNEEAWCTTCNRYCRIAPARDAGELWVEVAGVTCVGFSRIGGQQKWARESAIVCLAWSYWCSMAGPDIIFIECVSDFGSQ